jgi:hypothetical protein
MPGIRAVIARRRAHSRANTRPWIIINSFLSNVLDNLDLTLALGRRPFIPPRLAADNASYVFNWIVRRHLADIQVYDKCATSGNFRAALLQLAAIKAIRVLYPRCTNIYQLPYLDFIYFRAAQWVKVPILDITWNDQDLLKEMCSTSTARIILALHNGFAHTTRTVSLSETKIATVIGDPETILAFYQMNQVRNPQDIEIVPTDRHTLLTLTKITKQNKAIICAPDYINPVTGNCDILSLGMFKLAEYTEVPLYFVDYLIDESGVLRGFIKGPIDNKDGSESVAEDFLNFTRSISGRHLSIIHN